MSRSMFKKVLKEYCMVEDMRSARKFANENFNCSDVRKEQWLSEVEDALSGQDNFHNSTSYFDYQDYTDSLRRDHNKGIGL